MLRKRRGACAIAFSEILLLLSMSFAIAFLVSQELEFASAENPSGAPSPTSKVPQEISTQIFGDTMSAEEANKLGIKAASGTPATGKERGLFGVLKTKDLFWGHLLEGVGWAIFVVGAVQLIGNLAGLDPGTTNTLSAALGAGIFAGKGLLGLAQKTPKGVFDNILTLGGKIQASTGAFFSGVIIAAVIFMVMYKKEKKQLVRFECLPFEPALGGQRCEECNKDPFRPCSEYRCKSLGQACQLLNAGTGKEQCAWVSKFDVESPKITPWTQALSPNDLRYIPDNSVRPPALGVKITGQTSSGCLPAFTPLQFGFTTDEPAQCKMDYNHTANFDAMQYYAGGSNYYEYNHTQVMRLPGPSNLSDLAPLLRNDGSFALYTRCRDANGNVNVDEYSFSFCVDTGPDTTPPRIESTSIPSGSFVQHNIDKVPIEVYVNEPAECRWSIQSKAFEDMENTMACAGDPSEVNANLLYTCSGNLTGIRNQQDNVFYFRCKDQPGKPENERYKMVQSYEFVLKGSQPLTIDTVRPNETITGSTTTVKADLFLETGNGAQEGKAICSFSQTGEPNSFIAMFETNSHMHKQTLQLVNGTYQYFLRCVDSGGNSANANATFGVSIDKAAPIVTRVYRDQALKIVTDEDAECRYSLTSCNFDIDDGLRLEYPNIDTKNQHYADWKPGTTYYIRCRDKYDNEPSPNACSVIARPTELSGKISEP